MEPRSLWRRWLLLVTLGELAGFTVPAAVGVWSFERSAGAQLFLMTVAGFFEGGLLGLAQAAVLRKELAGFRARAWVVAISLAAAVAWFLGMLPSATHDVWTDWAVGWIVLVGCLLGTALLVSIGVAQTLVLPHGTPQAPSWVLWTALGWFAGLTGFFLVAPPLWHEGQPLTSRILIGLAGGIVMAAVMAAITGWGMVRLVARSTVANQVPVPDRMSR